MKNYYLGAILSVLVSVCGIQVHSQTINENYQDGKIYLKLKSEFPLQLIATRDNKPIKNLLQQYHFVSSVAGQFGITSMIRPFPKAMGEGGAALQRTFIIEFDNYNDVELLIRQLQTNTMVDYVEKVPLYKTGLVPNDPSHGSLWGLSQIQAELAWNVSTGNSNVVVAVTDNAIETGHADLTNIIWTNPGEIPGNGIDDDGNGYVDDVNGYDVGDDDNNTNPLNSSWSHGTHCSGTVGAESNNGIGVSSIGYGISLMPVKVTTNSASSSSVTNGYDGIYYATLSGADVISCSWGGTGYSSTGQNLVTWAWNQGSIVVAAAGNDNDDMDVGGQAHYPSNYDDVVCVASSRTGDLKSGFSNYGSAVDVTAPGSSIYSTVPFGNYGTMSGTSMATPLVSGLLGLMISAQPGLPIQDYVDCLISSCDDISTQNPSYIGDLGAGRVNAFAALNCVTSFSSNAPVADFQANFTTITTGGTIQFTDLSTYNPSTWSWNFDNQSVGGVSPATITGQGPHNVTFNTAGVFEVTLTVTNGNGSNMATKTAYITVNSPAGCSQLNLDDPTFATLASIHVGWTASNYNAGTGNGFVAGNNTYGDKAKAEYFPAAMVGSSTNVVGAYVWFGTATSGNASQTIDVNVYDATGGTPGAILGTRTVTMGDIDGGGIYYYTFNPPIAVPASSEIAVGVDFSNIAWGTGDSISIITNATGEPSSTIGFEMWDDDVWYIYPDGWGAGNTWNHYIFPDLTSAPAVNSLSASATTICEGESIDFDATGSTFEDTLLWTFQGSNPVNSTNVMESTIYNNSGTYTAYLEVIGGGCSNYIIDSVTITVNPGPTVILTASDIEICVGEGPVTITATGATSYVWTPGGQTSSSISVSPIATTNYSVVGTTAGCEGVGSIQVTVGEIPVITSSITNVNCNGQSTGAIDISAANVTSFTADWGAQGTTEDLTGLAAGSYSVTVTSDLNCVASSSITVSENAAISVTENTTNASCAGSDGTVTLTISGGVGPYNEDFGADNPNGLTPGAHTYVVTDALSCVYNGSYSISTTGGPTLVVSSGNVTCNGGNDGDASVAISGGTAPYSEDWGGATITALTAGTYSVTVTDAGSCISSEVVTITEPAAIATSPSISDASCNGFTDGTVNLNTSGGVGPYSENWAGENPSALGAGTYPVIITDASSCVFNTNVTITEPSSMSATATLTEPDCNAGTDGTAFLNISGGTPSYSENWQGNTNTALGAGTYTVIITDANSCVFNYDVTITEPMAITITPSSTDVTCFGFTDGTASLTISGGTPAYSEDWGTANPNNLAAGTHNVTVTDANGCSNSSSVTISEPTALTVTGVVTDENLGNDGAVDITAGGGTPGYTYDWGTNGTNEDLTSLAAGTYTVTVTDANGCIISDSYVVNDLLGVEGNSSIVFNVFPNPVTSILNIELQGEFTYTVVNDLGQLIVDGADQNTTIVDLSLFNPGVYFVRVQQGAKLFTTKVVKN